MEQITTPQNMISMILKNQKINIQHIHRKENMTLKKNMRISQKNMIQQAKSSMIGKKLLKLHLLNL
jgi:hypothetical protein